ncbi:hypothetical protein NLJ89_g9830 [Agrocybe chaxingu]|uniref:Aminoglycoside phosphotransferase domain-containing protein n=1 Tax=Agrocybe chaxingu TaxID=84603 RepID=A0A9W8MT63_9AGAR|nr:hypothetical protein NLJ89_g9830 [Agrocybe chaxingu]
MMFVCGGRSGSGKTSFTRRLHESLFMRPRDRRIFWFSFVEGDSRKPISFPGFDFTIFTISLEDGATVEATWRETKGLILEQYPQYLDKICILGTKSDLVAHDFTDEDIPTQRLPTCVPFYGGMKYFATSAVTGSGIEELLLYIANQVHPPPAKQNQLQCFLRNATELLLNIIASAFALQSPRYANDETADTYDLPNDEAVAALCSSPIAVDYDAYHAKHSPWGGSPAKRITSTLIAKPPQFTERANTMFARAQFKGVPIPQPRYPHLREWYITDFVKGRMLLDCWDSLSVFKKFRIACTLRTYISQMRRFSRFTPGSVDGGHIYGNVYDGGERMFYGPFDSSRKFHQWVHDVLNAGWLLVSGARAEHMRCSGNYDPTLIPTEPRFSVDFDQPLVFTHGDLSPSNVILSDDGVLWLVDWADSGYYPRWMEALAAYQYENHCSYWKYLLWFVVGPRLHFQDAWAYFIDRVYKHGSPTPREPVWKTWCM